MSIRKRIFLSNSKRSQNLLRNLHQNSYACAKYREEIRFYKRKGICWTLKSNLAEITGLTQFDIDTWKYRLEPIHTKSFLAIIAQPGKAFASELATDQGPELQCLLKVKEDLS